MRRQVEADVPAHLREGQFDVFLLFCEEDAEKALKFVRFLEEQLSLRVCILDESIGDLIHISSKFSRIKEAIERSLFTFIFVTATLLQADRWDKYYCDAALAESIDKNQAFVVPVRPEDVPVPFALNPLTSLRIYPALDHLPEHPLFARSTNAGAGTTASSSAREATSGTQICFVKKRITNLMEEKKHVKKDREEDDKRRREEWIHKETLRRYKEMKRGERDEKERRKEMLEEQRRIEAELEEEVRTLDQTIPMRPESGWDRRRDWPNPNGRERPGIPQQPGYPAPDLNAILHDAPREGVTINYVLPTGGNLSDLAPRHVVHVQAAEIRNLQVGSQNTISSGAPPQQQQQQQQQQQLLHGTVPEPTEQYPGNNANAHRQDVLAAPR